MKIVPTILNSSSFDSKFQVDSVHVMDKVVVSGSRDRGISVWSIDQVLLFLCSNDDDDDDRSGVQLHFLKTINTIFSTIFIFCNHFFRFWPVGRLTANHAQGTPTCTKAG